MSMATGMLFALAHLCLLMKRNMSLAMTLTMKLAMSSTMSLTNPFTPIIQGEEKAATKH
jgi:hypothetical protein